VIVFPGCPLSIAAATSGSLTLAADEAVKDRSSRAMSGSNPLPGGQGPQPQRRGGDDDVDYKHRNFVNLVALAVLLAIAVGVVWVVKAMEANEALNRCLATGRRDCVRIDAPPRPTIRMPDN
jgi:hypothetical protein